MQLPSPSKGIFALLFCLLSSVGFNPSNAKSLNLINNPDDGQGYQGFSIVFGNNIYFQYQNTDGNGQLAKFDGKSVTLINNPDNGSGYYDNPIVLGNNLYIQHGSSSGDQLAEYNGVNISLISTPASTEGYEGNPFVFGNNLYLQYYDNAGIYHLAQLALPCTPTSTTVTVSAYGSYTWHGTTYTASTSTATFDTTNAAGCDSLTTLNLTIMAPPQPSAFTYTTPDSFLLGAAITPLSPIPHLQTSKTGGGLYIPAGVAVDGAGNLYVADLEQGLVILGKGVIDGLYSSVAVDAAGNLYLSDISNNVIDKVTPNGTTTSFGSGYLTSPNGVAVDAVGNIYVADQGNAIYKITTNGNVTTLGSGFNQPSGVAVDAAGNVYVADLGNALVKKIATDGTVTTIGSGFVQPAGVAVDAAGNVFVVDIGAVYKIDAAGNTSFYASTGGDGTDIAVDAADNVYITNEGQIYVYKTTAGGAVSNYSISPALPTGLSLDSITGIISGTPTTTINNTTFTVTATNAGGNKTTTLNISVLVNTWTGIKSSDWFDASNWTVGVPDSTTDAEIPAAPTNQPTNSSTGAAYVKNLTIDSGATFSNIDPLYVYGNFTNSGSFKSSGYDNVVLVDYGTISGTDTFANLEIQGNYRVGASTTDKAYVTGKLIKTSGTLSTSDKLTLISNASGSALIEENGGALTGKAYIQHYAGGNFGYHHFSSPISDGTVNSWSNAFPITGPDGAPSWLSNWGSLQIYDEVDNGFSILDSGYYNYTATSKALTPGKGYTAWLNSLPTLNTFGTPNNGAISIPVTHSTGTNAPKGWNFVGNPYPSPISWKALKTLNPGLFGDASCYLWKASGVATNGTWTAYDGTVGVNGAGDVINSSLGFFVYVTNSGTLNFNNTVRTYSYTNPEIFGTQSTAATSTLRISIKDEAARTTDEIVAYTSNQAGFSRKMAQPATATNATIAFDVNGTKAAINTLTALDSKTELPITVLTPRAGTYIVSLSTKNINLPVYLKDAVTGTYTDLSANITITTTKSETAGRYSLVFSMPNSIVKSQLSIYPNPVKSVATIKGNHIALVQVVDNIGRVVKTVTLKDATNPVLSVNGLQVGVYHLRIQTTDGNVSGVGMVKE